MGNSHSQPSFTASKEVSTDNNTCRVDPTITHEPQQQSLASKEEELNHSNLEKKSPVNKPRSVVTIEDIHEALDLAPLADVKEQLQSLYSTAQSLSSGDVDVMGALLCRKRRKRAANGSSFEFAAIHRWANDRYDLDDNYYSETQKTWLREMSDQALKRDAVQTLDLLLAYGADPYQKSSDLQTPLHQCMANGFENVVLALLQNPKVEYSLNHLNQFDFKGDSPLSAALSDGHYHCVASFLEHYPMDKAVYVLDKFGNNILALLCQYSNVDYHDEKFDANHLTVDRTLTVHLLRRVLEFVQRNEMVDVLMNQNRYGETCLHVAARCCSFLEVKSILEIDFGCGRPIANCWSNDLDLTPMQCTQQTLRIMDSQASMEDIIKGFEESHIYGLDWYMEKDPTLSNWKRNAIDPILELFRRHQTPKLVPMADIVSSRPGSKLGGGQRKSSSLADKFLKWGAQTGKKVRPGTIRCEDNKNWQFINGTSPRACSIRQQIEEICNAAKGQPAHSLRSREGVIHSVATFQIRDPLHSCLKRSSYALNRQYGILAKTSLPKDTVIGEYSGEIYRQGETDNDFAANSNYCMGIKKLDAYVAQAKPGHSEAVYILDASRYFNETALINDATADFMSDNKQERLSDTRRVNTQFVEILVGGFPRIFCITTRGLKAGEEILTLYGDAYWERSRMEILRRSEFLRGTARKRLRESSPNGDFIATPLHKGELQPLKWNKTSGMPQTEVAPHLYRLGTDNIADKLLQYCDRKGITTRARRITIGGGTLPVGKDELATMGGDRWHIQRHSSHDGSDLQWISPADESAHQDLLEALGEAGFTSILKSIGEKLKLNGLAVYLMNFICVSKCIDGRLHFDVSGSGGKAFKIILPILLAENTGPELEIRPANDSEPPTVGDYLFDSNSAIMVGDDVIHATGEVDYTREFWLALSIYVADISEANVNALDSSFTALYRPCNLLSLADAHWKSDDDKVCLPRAGPGHILKGLAPVGLVSRPKKRPATKGSSPKHSKCRKITSPRPSALEVWSGRPDDFLGVGFSWPSGWSKKTFERASGASKGHHDSYWYTPNKGFRLRSIVEVKRFMALLSEAGGDEQKAWAEFKLRRT